MNKREAYKITKDVWMDYVYNLLAKSDILSGEKIDFNVVKKMWKFEAYSTFENWLGYQDPETDWRSLDSSEWREKQEQSVAMWAGPQDETHEGWFVNLYYELKNL